MASIVHRNNRFLVVHYEYDEVSGKRKQKWETYRTLADAKRRKAEIERRQELGVMNVPTCKTVADLLKEYVSLYGTNYMVAIGLFLKHAFDTELHQSSHR